MVTRQISRPGRAVARVRPGPKSESITGNRAEPVPTTGQVAHAEDTWRTLTRQLLLEIYPGLDPNAPKKFTRPLLVGMPDTNTAVHEHASVLGCVGVESTHHPPAKVALSGPAYDTLVRANTPERVVVVDRAPDIGARAIDLAQHAITAGANHVDIISTDFAASGQASDFTWAIERDVH